MNATYIFHSGFLLETKSAYYLFDYYRKALPHFAPQKPVTFFCSHAHPDHFNPEVFDLLQKNGAEKIFGVFSEDIPERKYPAGVCALEAKAEKSYVLHGGEKLETLRSTDRGVAFLLLTDEGLVFHAGDLNDWSWTGESERDNRQMRGNFCHEIDKLRGREVETAFFPLDPRLETHYADGLLYFLSAVDVKNVYPMHYWEQPEVIDRFLREYPQYEAVIRRPEI